MNSLPADLCVFTTLCVFKGKIKILMHLTVAIQGSDPGDIYEGILRDLLTYDNLLSVRGHWTALALLRLDIDTRGKTRGMVTSPPY